MGSAVTDGAPPPIERARALPGLHVFHCHDWRLIRHLRLRALEVDPEAFLADSAAEQARRDDKWMSETAELIWVAATVAEHGVGLARSRTAEDGTHVESLWVHPAHRRRGVATRILHELLRREREQGVAKLFAWVLDRNPAAWSLGHKLGVESTDMKPLGDGRTELRLELPLDSR